MTFIYRQEPHPLAETVKSYAGHFLMTFEAAPGDRVLTDCENMALAIGGRHANRWSGKGRIAYTLSPAQARDMATLIDHGWRGEHMPRHMRQSMSADRAFWHPDHGDWVSRADALALCDLPARCRRTLDMDFSPPEAPCSASTEKRPSDAGKAAAGSDTPAAPTVEAIAKRAVAALAYFRPVLASCIGQRVVQSELDGLDELLAQATTLSVESPPTVAQDRAKRRRAVLRARDLQRRLNGEYALVDRLMLERRETRTERDFERARADTLAAQLAALAEQVEALKPKIRRAA